MMSMNLNDIATLNINAVDCRCIISGIGKREDVTLLQKADLKEKKWNIVKDKNILSHVKLTF